MNPYDASIDRSVNRDWKDHEVRRITREEAVIERETLRHDLQVARGVADVAQAEIRKLGSVINQQNDLIQELLRACVIGTYYKKKPEDEDAIMLAIYHAEKFLEGQR